MLLLTVPGVSNKVGQCVNFIGCLCVRVRACVCTRVCGRVGGHVLCEHPGGHACLCVHVYVYVHSCLSVCLSACANRHVTV